MPHRRYLLRDLVPTLMLQHEGTMKFISARKQEWAMLRQGTEKSRLDMEFFLARFDPSNYTETPQDDGPVLITMRWPPHLEQIAQQSQGDMNLRMLSMTLALRARRLLEGQETEVDRTVFEEIAGPLLHLMRNAANHALETPEIRIQKGKSPAGQIKLSASYEGNQVVITEIEP